MPIALPDLDDRRWSDLVEQGRALIPLYAPTWTDHNASDPGITLMELLAWIAEMDIYRLNRLTDVQKRRLLALMGVRPEPPRAATIVTELRLTDGGPAVALPAATEFSGTALDSTAVLLHSKSALAVAPASLRALQRKDATGFQNLTAAWARQDSIAPFGDDPAPGAEFYLGFDRPLPAGIWSQLYAIVEGERASLAERARIEADDGPGRLVHHGVRLGWDYLAAGVAPGTWRPLDVDDDTRAFSLSGPVRVRPDAPMQAGTLGRAAQPQFWLRCRVAAGGFDAAPRLLRLMLNGVELVQSVPVTSSWPIAKGTLFPQALAPGQAIALRLDLLQGQIVGIAVDSSADAPAFTVLDYVAATATAAGRLAIEGALAGSGTGEPTQRITLGQRPLVEASLSVFTREGAGYRAWTRVDDFSASTRVDAHFQVDPTRGDILAGDGEQGRVFPRGCQVFAFHQALSGNSLVAQVTGLADDAHNRAFLVDAGAIGRVAAGTIEVLEAAAPAETLAHAVGRAMLLREARLRAVTLADFEAIALETPGLRVARAVATPNLYPSLECVSAPGVVSVIVLPSLPRSRPAPVAGFVERISARLEARRILGTRVVVTGPRYLDVGVTARVKAFDGVDGKRLAAQVAQALDAFFDPISGGPEGAGWPLGRDVYRSEVMQVIDETPGVDHVLSLDLVAQGCAPECGNVCLRPTWLVAAGAHRIEVV